MKFSYERLEFLGDSILGAIVATIAFHQFPDLDEGGLTRIKVALVSGASLSEVAEKLGFADVIVFGSSETGTGRRGLHSALENVYEAVVAALFLDGGLDAAWAFVDRTLMPKHVPRAWRASRRIPRAPCRRSCRKTASRPRTNWWRPRGRPTTARSSPRCSPATRGSRRASAARRRRPRARRRNPRSRASPSSSASA